jgi:hypothetical protein
LIRLFHKSAAEGITPAMCAQASRSHRLREFLTAELCGRFSLERN